MRYHVIRHWKTAATALPRESLGDWRITGLTKQAGLYPLQGMVGYYYLPEPIELTVLSEGDLVWFSDDPRQMFALAEIGLFRAHGKVVVGGLGLGLIHHFLRANLNVESVITVERAPELRELVWPYVDYGELIKGDFHEVLPTLSRVDTIITDFILGHQSAETWVELVAQREFCRQHFPVAEFLEHGYQHKIDEETVMQELGWPADGEPIPDKTVIVR